MPNRGNPWQLPYQEDYSYYDWRQKANNSANPNIRRNDNRRPRGPGSAGAARQENGGQGAIDAANLFEARLGSAGNGGRTPGASRPFRNNEDYGRYAQEILDGRVHNQSAPGPGGADYLSELQALFSKPDIPGQWISPYSQDYLNGLGDRLTQVGSDANNQYQSAIGDIVKQYSDSMAARDVQGNTTMEALGRNLQNIGVANTGEVGTEYAANNAHMDQVAGQNQATDTSFMTKLGQLASQLGSNLGMQAREGLLTPKQWQEGRSGMTDGDRLKASFLMDQMSGEQDYQRELSLMGADAENALQLQNSAEEQSLHKNPLVAEAFARLQGPTKDRAQSIYDLAEGDPTAALKIIQQQINERVAGQPSAYNAPRVPSFMEAVRSPRALTDNVKSRLRNPMGPSNNRQRAEVSQQNLLDAQLQELFRRLSPTYGGVPTSRSTTDKSTQKFS
jgi:hypothetical protein